MYLFSFSSSGFTLHGARTYFFTGHIAAAGVAKKGLCVCGNPLLDTSLFCVSSPRLILWSLNIFIV